MKYIKELLERVINGETPRDILTGLTSQTTGHVGEALLRTFNLIGIHPTNDSLTVTAYRSNLEQRRLEPISSISDRLTMLNEGLINSGSTGGKIDAVWRDGPKFCVCSSKIGMINIKSLKDLEIMPMMTEFTESGGYKENGKRVPRDSVVAYCLVRDKRELDRVAKQSKASNKTTKDNLNPLDIDDLNRMAAVLLERIANCSSRDFESILKHLLSDEKPSLRTRLHQKLICSKAMRIIASGNKTILIGALPRSGKTYMGAFISRQCKRILVITTRPSETRTQWISVFKNHRDFSEHMVRDVTSSSCDEIATANKTGRSMVAVASIQFFKMNERDALIGLDWDIVILDEIHEGGSTELSDAMIDTYVGPNPIRLMMTATYSKPMWHYNIPSECCLFWDLEDSRLMREWGQPDAFARLCEKHGSADMENARDDTYKSGETDDSIRSCYENSPRLSMFTTTMQLDIYDAVRAAIGSGTSEESVYGFSMRALLMPTKDGKAFQNQSAVDTFLALISGSEKTKYYKTGNMSMFARIRRHWKKTGHRDCDEFMTQVWFIPSGVGQLLKDVKPAMISRINANPVLNKYATLTLDSGMGDISKAVSSAVVDAKADGKHGLIILTGNVGSLGVSLPEVDVAFMMHDMESADMNYQQMMRVLTEMQGKKDGIVVDLNVWRFLNTINLYASRCGQANKSSTDRISWCLSNLIDVDPDMWDCAESPISFQKHAIGDMLTKQWRKMIECTGMSLAALARKIIDLGEDQKELDQIVHAQKCAQNHAANNQDQYHAQEKLSSGIEKKSEGGNESNEEAVEEVEAADKEEEEVLPKKANLNDMLARFIPDIAILSGCKSDLLEALETIRSHKREHAAMAKMIDELYMETEDASAATTAPLSLTSNPDSFDVLIKIIVNNYKKLNDARETFEVISGRMSVIDSPHELVAFIGQHLKTKEFEKKEFGEVFTPPILIHQKFGKLVNADPTIWTDPSKKFLDPANGIGNYPAIAYQHLMEGLVVAIPNEAARKKHILENMLYMCELNELNVEIARKLFDPDNIYDLKLYQGSYLDLDPMQEWGVERFDVVFGNPPYQPPSNGKKGGKSLWPIFVQKSMSLLKPNGFLVFVHPALWRKPKNELHDLMFGKQFHYLSIHTKQEGDKLFHATTRYDWYILQNTEATRPTMVHFDDGMELSVMIQPSLQFIPNHGHDIFAKILSNPGPTLNALSTHEGSTGSKNTSKTKSGAFCYPLVNSVSKTKGINCMYSSKPLKHQHDQKVIFSNGEFVLPFYDHGVFGTTQGGIFIAVSSEAEGQKIARFLKSKLIYYIVSATKWSNFETNKQIFWSIPHPHELPDNMTDAEIYAYFGLTLEEIGRIEINQPKGGLSGYVPLKAPDMMIPAASTPANPAPAAVQANPTAATVAVSCPYANMTVNELKKICKDKNIKGFSGKTKPMLIQLIVNPNSSASSSASNTPSSSPKPKKK
jgi:superfamily II DNA or RNA helicase